MAKIEIDLNKLDIAELEAYLVLARKSNQSKAEVVAVGVEQAEEGSQKPARKPRRAKKSKKKKSSSYPHSGEERLKTAHEAARKRNQTFGKHWREIYGWKGYVKPNVYKEYRRWCRDNRELPQLVGVVKGIKKPKRQETASPSPI